MAVFGCWSGSGDSSYLRLPEGNDLDSSRSEPIDDRVSKFDVFKIRAKQVGLVALAVFTAIVLSPVLLPVAIVGGIAFGGFKAIISLVSKVYQENQRLQEMRVKEERKQSLLSKFGF